MMLKGIFVAKVGNVYDSLIKKTRTPSKTQADGGRKMCYMQLLMLCMQKLPCQLYRIHWGEMKGFSVVAQMSAVLLSAWWSLPQMTADSRSFC